MPNAACPNSFVETGRVIAGTIHLTICDTWRRRHYDASIISMPANEKGS
jgi:hypothetical protein